MKAPTSLAAVLVLVAALFAAAAPDRAAGLSKTRSEETAPRVFAPDTLRLREIVTRLAAEDFQGRRCGEAGGLLARAYLAGILAQAGLEAVPPLADFLQPFDIEGESLASLEAALWDPAGRRLGLWLSVRAPLDRSTGSELRLWPEGEAAPACHGREMLFHLGPNGRESFFAPSDLQDEAMAAGASALILMPNPVDTTGLYQRYLGRVKGRELSLYRLPGEGAEAVLAYGDPAQAAPFPEGLAPGPGWRLELPASTPIAIAAGNLVVRFPSSAGQDARVLLLVAHYDHLGKTPTGYFPGADDNACAVAVLLELTRLLASEPLPCELRLLFSDGEELGYQGAKAYLRRFGAPWRVINLDSVGRAAVDSYAKLKEPGAASEDLLMIWHSQAQDRAAQRFSARAGDAGFHVEEARGPMFAKGGDHHVFAQAGVPSIFVFGGFHSDYNTENDRPERISPARLARLSKLMAESIVADLFRDQ